jgi:NAD(P)-dependent dehydrogenase (short-subunit alcohol dehydrogenase family)
MDSNSEKNALALQVIPRGWSASDLGDQSGKHFLITGATSGIGLESARELSRYQVRLIDLEILAKAAKMQLEISALAELNINHGRPMEQVN